MILRTHGRRDRLRRAGSRVADGHRSWTTSGSVGHLHVTGKNRLDLKGQRRLIRIGTLGRWYAFANKFLAAVRVGRQLHRLTVAAVRHLSLFRAERSRGARCRGRIGNAEVLCATVAFRPIHSDRSHVLLADGAHDRTLCSPALFDVVVAAASGADIREPNVALDVTVLIAREAFAPRNASVVASDQIAGTEAALLKVARTLVAGDIVDLVGTRDGVARFDAARLARPVLEIRRTIVTTRLVASPNQTDVHLPTLSRVRFETVAEPTAGAQTVLTSH